MEHARPSVGYVMLAYLLSRTNNNVVVTTNFDHLTEDAIRYYAEMDIILGIMDLMKYYIRWERS